MKWEMKIFKFKIQITICDVFFDGKKPKERKNQMKKTLPDNFLFLFLPIQPSTWVNTGEKGGRNWQIVSSIGFIQKKIIIIMIYSSVNHVIREKKLHFASFYYLYLRIGNQNAFSNLYFFPFECILFARKQNLEG